MIKLDKAYQVLIHLSLFIISLSDSSAKSRQTIFEIPDGFSIGAGTSAYQTEGSWNVDGKGESVWDRLVHTGRFKSKDNSTGDIAADSYRKYKEDVVMMKYMGLNHYRFSISWPRILPVGYDHKINAAGVKHYSDLIDELLANGIQPYVTLYHWDHPQTLEEMGSWTNSLMIEWFVDYARVVFELFGSRVKVFTTINEPSFYCNMKYEEHRPGKLRYICGHNILKAHARVYRMYDQKYRKEQKGVIGIANVCHWFESLYANDTYAAEVAFQYMCGWFSHPIFSLQGGYPPVMKKRIDENSRAEGLPVSRLPKFSRKWKNYIKGTADFYGLNHYTTHLAHSIKGNKSHPWFEDSGVVTTPGGPWPSTASYWLFVAPDGFGKVLRKIRDDYRNPVVYVLENGYPDNRTTLYDPDRIRYIYSYMKEMLLAMQDGCNIQCYTVWSLIDTLEWLDGHKNGYGLVSVNFTDAKRQRTPKYSSYWFSNVIRSGMLFQYKRP